MTIKNDQYKGFALFSDITDVALRTRNRAVVLANIATDNTRNRRISPSGAGLILGYFNAVPEDERAVVQNAFKSVMSERGYGLAN